MWGFGGMMTLGVMVLIVLAAWWFLSHTNREQSPPVGAGVPWSPPSTGRERTRQVLDGRYAAGEMNTEEYTERLRTLGL